MRLRFITPVAAMIAAAAFAAPVTAGDATFQVQVMESALTCHVTLSTVDTSKRLILFHIINNSSTPRGIMVWGVQSTMALPNQSANLYVMFRGPGNYPLVCTAGSYNHPTITGRGTFSIGIVNGRVVARIVPARGGSRGALTV
ncbi:MAG TPA: hypothetical protein VKP14_11950 [Gaiellaceae bacterium]|nr:hypothetical protein [Gaiellaceae bacterium]